MQINHLISCRGRCASVRGQIRTVVKISSPTSLCIVDSRPNVVLSGIVSFGVGGSKRNVGAKPMQDAVGSLGHPNKPGLLNFEGRLIFRLDLNAQWRRTLRSDYLPRECIAVVELHQEQSLTLQTVHLQPTDGNRATHVIKIDFKDTV